VFVDSAAECDLWDWFPEIEELVSGSGNPLPSCLGNLLGSQHPWFALAPKFSFADISDCVARNPSVGSGVFVSANGRAGVPCKECLEFKFEFEMGEVHTAAATVALTFLFAPSKL
jgi:hypothetical protein